VGFGVNVQQALPGTTGLACTTGDIMLTATKVASHGVPADGRTLLIADYPDLFSYIKTTYGGNGTTNFMVPDLRAVTPNNMTYTICADGTNPVPDFPEG
jgi:microcystin-dependent protein